MTVRSIILHVFRTAILLAGLLSLSICCTRLDSHSGLDSESPRELVPVNLSLTIAPEEDGTPATKTDYEPDASGYNAAEAIKTLLLLQFEWRDAVNRDAAKLISQQFVQYGDPVSLVTSSAKNTVFVVANAWGKAHVAIGTTLGTFLEGENCNQLNSLDEITGKGIWYSPNGGTDKYLRMSASLELPDGVDTGTAIGPVYLKRNCAKVVINLKNSSTAPDKISIDKVQLRGINRKYYYVTNCASFADSYSPAAPYRFDDAERDFPAAYNISGATQTYTYYVTANLRGTVTNDSQSDKNYYARQGATYFCIYATYDSPAKNITYTYYLGADLTSDFNLEPNKKYIYNIDLNGKGNSVTDSRIEDVDEVRFTKDANCYMLKPPARSGASTTFLIPVRRAAVFWNQAGTNMGVYGAADRPAYTLLEDTEWEASFVWNEIEDKDGNPVSDAALLVNNSGRGFNPTSAFNPYIRVRISAGMKGNAVIAIKKTSGETLNDVLWSWHVWVTDYDPYIDRSPAPDTYVYTLPNGEIHRYADGTGKTLWTSGDYKTAFMMDRNVGALTSNSGELDTNPAIGCYYQWGRKDPFPTTGTVTTITADQAGTAPEGAGVKYNIRYAIHNPDMFITPHGSNVFVWTAYENDPNGAIIGRANAAYIDPKAEDHSEATDYCETGKSIYDPCPYGWRLPLNDAWSGITASTKEILTSRTGGYYYPGGISAGHGRIYFPFTGWRRFNTGVQEATTVFSCMRGAFSTYQFYTFNGGYNATGDQSGGVPARCVRLSHKLPY